MADYLLSKRDHGICDLCGSTDFLQDNHICDVCNSSEDREVKPRAKRKTISEEVKSYRLIAKRYGASNLTGSMKQKEWGEKIRAFILQSPELSEDRLTHEIEAVEKKLAENKDKLFLN